MQVAQGACRGAQEKKERKIKIEKKGKEKKMKKKYDHIAGVLKGALRSPWALKEADSHLRGPRLLEKKWYGLN